MLEIERETLVDRCYIVRSDRSTWRGVVYRQPDCGWLLAHDSASYTDDAPHPIIHTCGQAGIGLGSGEEARESLRNCTFQMAMALAARIGGELTVHEINGTGQDLAAFLAAQPQVLESPPRTVLARGPEGVQ